MIVRPKIKAEQPRAGEKEALEIEPRDVALADVLDEPQRQHDAEEPIGTLIQKIQRQFK